MSEEEYSEAQLFVGKIMFGMMTILSIIIFFLLLGFIGWLGARVMLWLEVNPYNFAVLVAAVCFVMWSYLVGDCLDVNGRKTLKRS